jgi:hypothetical protein
MSNDQREEAKNKTLIPYDLPSSTANNKSRNSSDKVRPDFTLDKRTANDFEQGSV